MVDRQVDDKQIRNHVLRKSTDGGATFGAPVEISDDGWQVPSCPHSGPSIGRDSRGRLHVSWFTLGRSEKEAGIYYSVSKDDGKSFAPRRLVQANTAPEVLYNNLAVGEDDTVYLVWSNLDAEQSGANIHAHDRRRRPDLESDPTNQQCKRQRQPAGFGAEQKSAARSLDRNRRRELARRPAKRHGESMKILAFRTKRSRWFLLCALSLASWCIADTAVKSDLSQAQLVQQASPTPGPAVGRAAIAFNLHTLDGKSIALETFRGKPFVLNFFASWCDPCRDEMPLINELAAKARQGRLPRARRRR